MTEADPAFDTVHPSGHILVRSCRGGYMHSVTLTEAAMNTDAESLTEGILLTADVSYLKAVMRSAARPWAAATPRQPRSPLTTISTMRSKGSSRTNYPGATAVRLISESRS